MIAKDTSPRSLVHTMDFAEPRRRVFEVFLDCFKQFGDVTAYQKSGNFIEVTLGSSIDRGHPTCKATFESGDGRTTVTLRLNSDPRVGWHKNLPLEPEVERIERQLAGANLKSFVGD